MRKHFYLLLLCLPLAGCGEMLSALSGMAESQGSVCELYSATTSLYWEGDWQKNMVMQSVDGTDISYKEESWLNSKVYGYQTLYQFNTYYVTSPHSGYEYKIHIYCGSWANQSGYSNNYYTY